MQWLLKAPQSAANYIYNYFSSARDETTNIVGSQYDKLLINSAVNKGVANANVTSYNQLEANGLMQDSFVKSSAGNSVNKEILTVRNEIKGQECFAIEPKSLLSLNNPPLRVKPLLSDVLNETLIAKPSEVLYSGLHYEGPTNLTFENETNAARQSLKGSKTCVSNNGRNAFNENFDKNRVNTKNYAEKLENYLQSSENSVQNCSENCKIDDANLYEIVIDKKELETNVVNNLKIVDESQVKLENNHVSQANEKTIETNEVSSESEIEDTFSDRGSMSDFEDSDLDVEDLTCNVCDRIYVSLMSLMSHQHKRKHFKCSLCSSTFQCWDSLHEHVEIEGHFPEEEADSIFYDEDYIEEDETNFDIDEENYYEYHEKLL